jgi:replicative DNA helicase
MTNNVDTLQKYGTSFQIKVITSLLTDITLLETLNDIIKPTFFDSDTNRWIVNNILTYYENYKKLPTMDVFKTELSKSDDVIFKKMVVDSLRDVYIKIGITDLDYIKTEFSNFCKNQRLKQAIIQSVDLLKLGEYDRIKDIVDSALKVGEVPDLGHEYVEGFDERNSEINRTTMSTPWQVVNDLMDGGLGGGELGVIVSPSGVGKSWVLAMLGAHLIKLGKNVVHYTLELNEYYVGKRYDTIFTGIPMASLNDNTEKVRSTIQKLPGSLRIKYFPPKGVSYRVLETHVDKLIATDNKPDLIIVDYADLLLSHSNNSDSTYQEQGGIYVELRGLSGVYDIPIWTASQTNRQGGQTDIIQADSIADSYAKVMHSDFIMSLSRKASDKINDTARIHIMKNRFGPDGLTLPSKMNTNTGEMEIFDSKSSDGKVTELEAKNGEEVEKKLLFKKYLELSK